MIYYFQQLQGIVKYIEECFAQIRVIFEHLSTDEDQIWSVNPSWFLGSMKNKCYRGVAAILAAWAPEVWFFEVHSYPCAYTPMVYACALWCALIIETVPQSNLNLNFDMKDTFHFIISFDSNLILFVL